MNLEDVKNFINHTCKVVRWVWSYINHSSFIINHYYVARQYPRACPP